jgi:hypothetical protein
MVSLETFARRAAYAVAAGQQHPATVDAKKLELIAREIENLYAPGASARELFFSDLASGQEHRVYPYVQTIEHRLNTNIDGQPKRGDKISVTAKDLIYAAPYARAFEVLKRLAGEDAQRLEKAFESNDLPALERAFKQLNLEAEPAWAARLFRNVAQKGDHVGGVEIRSEPVDAFRAIERDLDEAVARIHASAAGAEKDEHRQRAAELFAKLVNVAALLTRSQRYEQHIDLEQHVEVLGLAGVPGFLPSRGGPEWEVLGQKVNTRFDLRNPVIQLVTIPLGLETRGNDPSRYRPGSAQPEIVVAEDRRHLGTPDAPIGFVSGEYAVVPETIDLVLINKSKYAPIGNLGFGEMPVGAFAYETRYWGTALKVPLEVDVGDRTLALSHGEYRVVRGDPEGVKIQYAPGRVRIEAGGVVTSIDTKTGAVE